MIMATVPVGNGNILVERRWMEGNMIETGLQFDENFLSTRKSQLNHFSDRARDFTAGRQGLIDQESDVAATPAWNKTNNGLFRQRLGPVCSFLQTI